ncbi:MAG: glycosyltransferase family 39 protein [Pelagibacteraceae bacterium]
MNSLIHIKYRHAKKVVFTFFLLLFLVGFFTYQDYGMSIDEEFQRSSGFFWLNYVLSFTSLNDLNYIVSEKFSSISGFTLLSPENISFYGVIFDLPLALIETIFKIDDSQNYFFLRHYTNFFIFFISSIFFYFILKNRFKYFSVSFIGTLFYILSPRIYGASFYNNKDILFLSLVTITLYFCHKALTKINYKNIIIFSLFCAFCTSTRIVGIIFPFSFLLIYFLSLINNKKKIKQLNIIVVFLFSYLIFLFIHWPYLWSAPLENFANILNSYDKYLIEIKVLFNGNYENSKFLPYSYIPLWLLITTPVVHILFFLYGFQYKIRRTFKRFLSIKEKSITPDFWRGSNEKNDFYMLFVFLSILLYLISLKVTLYNSWRHIFFLNIFVVYFSTLGFYCLFNHLNTVKKKFSLILFVLLFFIMIIYKMISYHPYQNIYFNSLVPNNFKNKFEIDYMGISGLKFLKKIINLVNKKDQINIGVASFLPLERSLALVDKESREKINFVGQNYESADFIYTNNISEVDKNLNKKYDIPTSFVKIDEFIVDGAKVYEVYKNNLRFK